MPDTGPGKCVLAYLIHATQRGRPRAMSGESALAHRSMIEPEAEFNGVRTEDVITQVLKDVPPPRSDG